jgi:hypothetical protein
MELAAGTLLRRAFRIASLDLVHAAMTGALIATADSCWRGGSRPGFGKMHRRAANIHARGREMGVLDKVKAAAGQATTKAQDGVATMQTKRKLAQAYAELGQTTYELVQSGELTHPRLSPTVEQIRAVNAQLDREDAEPTPPPATAPGTPPQAPPVPPL